MSRNEPFEVPAAVRVARLIDLSHHWWVEGMRPNPGPDRDAARACHALAHAFLLAEVSGR